MDSKLRQMAEKDIQKHLKQWLLACPEIRGVMGYIATQGEVDVAPLLDDVESWGVPIYLPRVVDKTKGKMVAVLMPSPWRDHVSPGAYGITEPVSSLLAASLDDISMVVVPGVVFDKSFGRIGFGGGYYDRFLPQLVDSTQKVGVSFAIQLVDDLPRDEHDVLLDVLCNEHGVLIRGLKT